MAEHPILFSAPMIRAILAGQKTQTRRVVRWRGVDAGLNLQFSGLRPIRDRGGMWALESDTRTSAETRSDVTPCPYGAPGDRLWVRETCRGEELPDGLDGVRYLADSAFHPIENTEAAVDPWMKLHHYRGQRAATVPGIHMPRWASRITLEITDVRVERLANISEAEALAEGCALECMTPTGDDSGSAIHGPGGFAALWTSINGADSWAANPWVWAIDFRRMEAPTT